MAPNQSLETFPLKAMVSKQWECTKTQYGHYSLLEPLGKKILNVTLDLFKI